MGDQHSRSGGLCWTLKGEGGLLKYPTWGLQRRYHMDQVKESYSEDK